MSCDCWSLNTNTRLGRFALEGDGCAKRGCAQPVTRRDDFRAHLEETRVDQRFATDQLDEPAPFQRRQQAENGIGRRVRTVAFVRVDTLKAVAAIVIAPIGDDPLEAWQRRFHDLVEPVQMTRRLAGDRVTRRSDPQKRRVRPHRSVGSPSCRPTGGP